MENLNETLTLAKQNNCDAMEKLLKEYKTKVVSISREYFLVGAEFDDILQEGFIALYRAILSFDENKNDNFSAYASMCIHRGIQTAIKNANRKKNAILNDYLSINILGGIGNSDLCLIIDTKTLSIEQKFLSQITAERVTDKIKKILSDVQFDVFTKFLNGYTYSEIAKFNNLTTKQVDNLLQIIKRKLNLKKDELLS